jgi:PilZ domain
VLLGVNELSVACVISDMSETGARLEVPFPPLNLPSRFTLSLDRDCKFQHQCEVVWTDARYVGVKFVSSNERP